LAATINKMILGFYPCAKFDNDDIAIGLVTIAITIFYIGRHQGLRYKVIFSVIVVVELMLIGLLWWTLRGIGVC
jgi:hypothetical protein